MNQSGRRRIKLSPWSWRGEGGRAARRRRRLAVEGLECRTLLAHTPVEMETAIAAPLETGVTATVMEDELCECSNVSVRVQRQTLFIRGDHRANFVHLTMDTNRGALQVAGLGTTRINNDVQPFSTLIGSVRDIDVELHGDADQLIIGDVDLPFLWTHAGSDLRIEMGSGADIVVLIGVEAAGDVYIETGSGDDDLDILESAFLEDSRVEIRMGDGQDHFVLRDSILEDRTFIALGNHSDIMIVEGADLLGETEVDAGPGDDWALWLDFGIGDEFELDTQQGADTIYMEFGAFEDRARVDAGWDDDVVVLIDLTAESELQVDGNRGDDLLATTVEVDDESFEEVVTEFDASPLFEDLGEELAERLGLDPEFVEVETVTDAADLILEFVEQQLDHSGAPLAADVDQDGDVDAADLTIVIINWTRWWDPPRRDSIPGDVDCDGDVDSADLTILITQWTGDTQDNDNLE